MRNILLILTTLLLVACGHKYENTAKQKELYKAKQSQPTDTLICVFRSNTGSLDLFCLQGQLTLSADIKQQLTDTLTRDIKVCGNFPKDLINMGSLNYNPDLAFKVIGKTILADTISAYLKDRVPLFYVTDYSKFYYNYHSWTEKGDLGTFPNRAKMVDDILKHLNLKGQSLNEVINLLGQPDFRESNEIGYKINEDYGTDIDPIATITLTFNFNQDSIITQATKDEWRKNSR